MLVQKGINHLLLVGCLLFLITSCEDKESSQEGNSSSPAQTQEQAIKDAVIQENGSLEADSADREPNAPLVQEELIPFLTEFGENNKEDRIRITSSFGDIEVQLFHDTPLHRANFIYLVKKNYFKNTSFHRVTQGFVVQGGNSDNPETNEKRSKIGDYLIPSEFEAGHRHVRGAFSAAKYTEQNVSKASSPFEFFIVQSQNGAHHLDNDHTVYGRVTKGMDVVDEISKLPTDGQDWPMRNIYIDVELIE